MTDELDEQLSNEIKEASEAKALLANPLYKMSFITYKARLFEAFSESKDGEVELRQSIYRQMKSLRQVEANLTKLVTTGKLALKEVNTNDGII